MFSSTTEPTDRYARAVGRIVFGAVLLVGAAILVDRLTRANGAHVTSILGATWTFAFVAGWLFRQLAVLTARRDDASDIIPISFVVPALGIALLLPLTLHLPVALGLGVSFEGFDEWASLSVKVTAPAHIAFALLAAIRANALAHGRTAISARYIYVATLIVSCIPFALLLFIPPLLVGFTGLAILPLLERMPKLIERERQNPLPSAIVLS